MADETTHGRESVFAKTRTDQRAKSKWIPAFAGTTKAKAKWIPASTGMTTREASAGMTTREAFTGTTTREALAE
jgi:hypothetical protein